MSGVAGREINNYQLVSNTAELHELVEVCVPYIASTGKAVVNHQGLDSASCKWGV